MSLALQKLDTVLVKDELMNVNHKRQYAIVKSGKEATYFQATTNNISTSNISWTITPPSNVIVDRKVYCRLPIRLTLTGSAAVPLLTPKFDAPRQFPLAAITDSLTVKINGSAVSMQVAELIHPLMHFNTDSKLKTHELSSTPSCPDQSQEYHDLNSDIRNPLQMYGDSNDENVMGRGGFPFKIVRNDGSGAIVDFVVTEPLFMNPFAWGSTEHNGFVNIQSMDFNFNFISNAWARVWSHDDNLTALTGGSVQFNNFPSSLPFSYESQVPLLLFKYVSPQDLTVIPKNLPYSYPYFDVQRYITTFGSVVAGGATPINSNNIRLTSVPRRMFLFARNTNNTMQSNARYTDSFASITGVSINWNNRNSLLNTASQEQLYQISRRNGCNLSYTQWAGIPVYKTGDFTNQIVGCSSIMCINPVVDLGLGELEAAGLSEDINLQITVQIKNTGANPMIIDLYLVIINEGVFTITGSGSAETQINVLSRMDILDAQQSPAISLAEIKDNFGAGSFLSGLKDKLKESKIVSTVGKLAAPLMSLNPATAAFAPVVGQLANSADQYGYGEGQLIGAEGGRRMSRSSLRHRLRKY